jgi:hypothetical protein
MNWTTLKLEEAPVFRIESPNVKLRDGLCLTMLFDGDVLIKYRSTEDWWIDGITTNGWNGKHGKDCESWETDLARFPDLFSRVSQYVLNFRSEDVEEAIVQDMQDRYNDQRFQEGKDRRLNAAE